MIEKVGLKDESQIILPSIANRMSKIPYAESCKFPHSNILCNLICNKSLLIFILTMLLSKIAEEVRVELIELLEVCLEADP